MDKIISCHFTFTTDFKDRFSFVSESGKQRGGGEDKGKEKKTIREYAQKYYVFGKSIFNY